LSGQRSAVLLDTVTEPHYIKCVGVWGGKVQIRFVKQI
jgi:hypothetical protein